MVVQLVVGMVAHLAASSVDHLVDQTAVEMVARLVACSVAH